MELALEINLSFFDDVARLGILCVSGGLHKNQCVLNIDIFTVNIVCIAPHLP